MSYNNTALFIIDVQNGFINDHTAHIPAKVEALQNDYQHIHVFQFENYEGSPWDKWINFTKFMKED